jgi:hypothetical protein
MGRWIVYFSLAALPLFGLGQSLIPADDDARRRYAFWLMSIYIASGLGLLATTTLLGLRRYLRQRKLHMPTSMTSLWLGAGAALIVVLLLLGAFLPRPNAEYALVSLNQAGSADRDASRMAQRSDSAGKGDGRGGAKGKADDAKDGSGKGQAGGKSAGKSGKPEGDGGDKGGGKGKSTTQAKGGGERSENSRKDDQADQSRETNQSQDPPSGAITAIANVVKWIVFALLVILFAVVVLWFGAGRLAGVSTWARQLFESLSAFWRSLFGGEVPESGQVVESVVVQERPQPFADFRNPFDDGSAAGQSLEELVQYSFTAFEAWAFERDLPRRTDETPLEFADRIAADVPRVDGDARRLTDLYVRLAYARQRLPATSREQVEAFWRALALI